MSRFVFTLTLPDNTGAAKMTVSFVGALRASGHEVTVVHGPVPDGTDTCLPQLRAVGAELILEDRLRRPVGRPLRRHLAAEVERVGAHAVIGVMQRDRALAMDVAAAVGVPGIVMVQNQHRFRGASGVAALKRSYYARSVRSTALAVCTSDVVQHEMIAFGVPAERTVMLPNGIPTGAGVDHERAAARAELGVADDERVMMSVGRLDPQKGTTILLDALGALPHGLPPWRLFLVGGETGGAAVGRSSQYAAELRAKVHRLGLDERVSFLGWRSDTRHLLSAADAYVQASLWEGPALPLAVMEAMDSGVATALTDCSGTPPGFVHGVHGLLAKAGDAANLRDRLVELLAADDPSRAAMGEAGRRYVQEQFDIALIADRFVAYVEGVISRPVTIITAEVQS